MSGRGGQIRTYLCECGFSVRANLRESNFRWKMHQKVCDSAKLHTGSPTFDYSSNGLNGIKVSRNGNVIYEEKKVTASTMRDATTNDMIHGYADGITVSELQTILDLQKK